MSVRFESANSESAAASAFFSADTAFAVGGWFYLTDLPGTGVQYTILELNDTSAFTGISVLVNSSGNLQLYTHNQAVTDTGSTTLSSGTWYYLWLRRAGTGIAEYNAYLDESTTAECTTTDSLGTDPDLTYGDSQQGDGDPFNGRLLNFKWWDADVAASQAASESGSCEHSLATDAYSEHILSDHTDLTDNGPGSRDLTASGTLSTEADEGSWSCGGGGSAALLFTNNMMLSGR